MNDIWQVALFNIVVAAKANGLRAIDCPYGDFNDNEGFKALAKSLRQSISIDPKQSGTVPSTKGVLGGSL